MEELHGSTASFFKHKIAAENSTTKDSSYIADEVCRNGDGGRKKR